MATTAAYDEIADWYETRFLAAQTDDPLGVTRALRSLLGEAAGAGTLAGEAAGAGTLAGTCLEIGCGTGVHAATVRSLGWRPLGVDISAGMLRWAHGRLPVVRADVRRLPFASGTFPAVTSVMVHTDMPAYPAILREAARVLAPGGRFVHIGVHPCFCGGFADRTDPEAVVIRPGYLTGHWTKASWTDQGVRDKVGATHWPLAGLLAAILDAGLVLERFVEGGEPTPVVLGLLARKPRGLDRKPRGSAGGERHEHRDEDDRDQQEHAVHGDHHP
jgi:SAM-dependent methyltransferase